MYLYIKTPLSGQSKYIPHLVEHCSILPENGNIQDFFAFEYCFSADTYSTYTMMEFPERYCDTILRLLQTPLKPWKVPQEKKVLRQELQEVNFTQELLEKIFCVLYQTRFNLNHTARVRFSDVYEYHTTYYTPSNWILCDEKYRICSNSYQFQTISFPEPQIKNEKFSLNVRGYKNFVRTTPKTWESHIRNAFLQELIDTWGVFQYRFWHNPIYHIPVDAYFFRSENRDILVMSEIFPDISEDFFTAFQKEFCEKSIENHFINKIIILIYLHLGTRLTHIEIVQYIQSYTYKKYQEYIWYSDEYTAYSHF